MMAQGSSPAVCLFAFKDAVTYWYVHWTHAQGSGLIFASTGTVLNDILGSPSQTKGIN